MNYVRVNRIKDIKGKLYLYQILYFNKVEEINSLQKIYCDLHNSLRYFA